MLSDGWKPRRRRGATGRPKAGRKRRGKRGSAGASDGAGTGDPQLLKQREELAHRFAELQWDLGGIAYEMARRDSFRLEVLSKRASKLQEVDAQLGQIDRVLKLDQAGAAGTCPSCGALQARGAVFCWKCGKEQKPTAKPSEKPREPTAKAKPQEPAAKASEKPEDGSKTKK